MALTDDEQAKLKEMLSSDQGKILQSWKDSLVATEIKKALDKNPGLPEVAKRIEDIKVGTDKKIKALELQNKVLRKCFDRNIKYETIEALGINFNDEAEIDSKLDLLEKDIELKRVR